MKFCSECESQRKRQVGALNNLGFSNKIEVETGGKCTLKAHICEKYVSKRIKGKKNGRSWAPTEVGTRLLWGSSRGMGVKLPHHLLLYPLDGIRKASQHQPCTFCNKHSWYSPHILLEEWVFVLNHFPLGDTHWQSHPMSKEKRKTHSWLGLV